MSEKVRKSSEEKLANFYELYKKFGTKIIGHFFVTTIWTLTLTLLLAVVGNIYSKKVSANGNYATLLPWSLQGLINHLTQKQFIFAGIILVFIYSFIYYFDGLWEAELRIRGGHHVKNQILDKFRRLPLEEKIFYKNKISTLVEVDAAEFGYSWEHLPNHVYHSALTIILLITIKLDDFRELTNNQLCFSLFWLVIINAVNFFFTKLVLKNERIYKERLTEETEVINKEREKSVLIDSMGLNSQYRSKQREISGKNEILLLSFSQIKSLSKVIPSYWLTEMFPYLLIFISGILVGEQLLTMWWIFENVREIFQCFWDYGDFASSRERINQFLKKEEKEENPLALQFNQSIKKIVFSNVYFKYSSGSSKPVLENYSREFTKGKINRLSGGNGTGKSTIIYLILGMLNPIKGKISIETIEGNSYNLHREINLEHWRRKIVAYAAHDNPIEIGSTGQRQSNNIKEIMNKKEAKIVILDEADNALDKDKLPELQSELKRLAKEGRLIIYTKH